MKIALVGFRAFPEHKKVLQEILTQAGHKIVDNKKEPAHLLIVPHHLDKLFPKSKPWVAVWIEDGNIRINELEALKNPPRNMIFGMIAHEIRKVQGPTLIKIIAGLQSE